MILFQPEKKIEFGNVVTSANIYFDKHPEFMPESLWFRYPEKYYDRINLRADGFVFTALVVAMYLGEDLIIEAPVSQRLAYHLPEYRNVFHSWYPKIFKKVNLKNKNVVISQNSIPQPVVGAAFSGGVDSFYTLWAHLPQNLEIDEYKITHGLFIHGMDIRLDDTETYDITYNIYNNLFEKLGLELIPVATNAYKFSEFRINWLMFHGAPLVGAALTLGPWMGKFIVPSAYNSYNNLQPSGANPVTDLLMSTEHTEIIHHAVSIPRYMKILELSTWENTYNVLRVCSKKNSSKKIENCCRCHKCYRNMAIMELLGTNRFYTTLPRWISFEDFFRWGSLYPMNPQLDGEIVELAFRKKNLRIWLGMRIAFLLYSIQSFVVNTIKFLLGKEQVFRLKRKIFKPEAY